MEIPRGREVLKAQFLEAKYEAKLEFPGGRVIQSKSLLWGSMADIIWNCMFLLYIIIITGIHVLTFSSLFRSTTDAFENLTMVILSSLLVSGPNSPFYQSLIEPNIGSDYCAGVG